jgi:hypothetical protein
MIAIHSAEYQYDYKIKLTFNTGEQGVVDLYDLIEKHTIAHPLKNVNAFRQFYLDEWPTLAWSCGFDIAPETLYERATGNPIAWLEK